MPDLLEQLYCSQQIHIPPTFPSILKLYAKAAIRTQPYDLLKWSAAYFRALAEGEEPPVKQRIEYPPVTTPSGLSPGFLKVLIKQLGKSGTVEFGLLLKKWEGICLNVDALHDMLRIGEFEDEIDWLKFVAIAAGHLTKSLTQTMYLLCELLTEEPEGGSDMIPLEIFTKLYTYLARLNCGTPEDEIPEDVEADGAVKDIEEGILDTVVEISKRKKETVEDIKRTLLENVLKESKEGKKETAEDIKTILDNEESKVKEETADDIEKTILDNVIEASNEEKTETSETSGESVGETATEGENLDDKKDEAIQISEEELNAMQVRKPPHLIPQEAVHVPGIGPILSRKHIEAVLNYLEYWAERQAGMVMPRNVHHFLCPPLDKVPVAPDTQ